jgi:hypothetical protein
VGAYWHYHPVSSASQDGPESRGGARCARGGHCLNATVEDGELTAAWSDPPSPFCGRDTSLVARSLAGLPAWYVALRVAIGDKPRGRDDKVSGSRAAPVPVRLNVDALIRDMITILCSWDERIADAHQLTRPATWLTRLRRDEVTIPATVGALTPRLPDLLQLPPSPMWRTCSLHAAAALPAGTPGRVHPLAGYAEVFTELDGTGAGLELLRLDYRCRRVLGHTTPPPVRLDGVPCRQCEALALEVAPEPQYRSLCADCGHLMSHAEYRDWARQYAAWARQRVMSGDLEPNDPAAYQKIAR